VKRRPKTKNFTLMIVPSDGSATRTYKLRKIWIKFLAFFLLLLLLISIVIGTTYTKLVQTALDFQQLKEDFEIVVSEREKIHNILRDIQKLRFYKNQVTNTLTGYVDMKKITTDSVQIDSPVEEFSLQSREETSQVAMTFQDYPVNVPLDGFITRKFELSGGEYTHPGIDIAATKGAPIKAAGGGIVVFADWTRSFGNTVVILHENGFHSHYSHCQTLLVKAGDMVSSDTVIATAGNTGQRTSGVHLHFELWRGNIPLDPQVFLNKLSN
jgi:murein DD-endopeptidase MepM/ murein hydrolase activator NlpD